MVKEQSVSHLNSGFSFIISIEELRGDFRNRGIVVTGRGGGKGSTSKGRLRRIAGVQLG